MYILIVDDDQTITDNLSFQLEEAGHNCFAAANAKEALAVLDKEFIQVCFLDYSLPDQNGLQLMAKIKAKNPQLVCVFITGVSTIGIAVAAIREGAYDFLEKPFDPEKIKIILNKVHNEFFKQTRVEYLENKVNDTANAFIVGQNPKIKEILDTVHSVCSAQTFSVLICGESGTGKDVLARYIHHSSVRRYKPFIDVNCSAIPAALLESELFGYERGAFTGADRSKTGLFELANEGVLFLDEIGDMPLEMQAKLLRALDNKTIRKVGGTENIPIDVSVIAATNKSLEKLIAEGKFREDLYYRINVIQINMPPLRERKEDIPLLINGFLYKFNQAFGKNIVGLEEGILDIFYNYNFPGNIRELRNIIERAFILEKKEILSKALFQHVLSVSSVPHKHSFREHQLPYATSANYDQSFNEFKKSLINECEKKYLALLLKRTAGNVTIAAHVAGIPRTSLSRLLGKHEIYFKEFKE